MTVIGNHATPQAQEEGAWNGHTPPMRDERNIEIFDQDPVAQRLMGVA
jgi:hypothetical protein